MEERDHNIDGTPTVNKRIKWLKALSIAGYAASGVTVAAFLVMMFAVVCDWSILIKGIMLPVIFLSLLTSVTGIVASFIDKRWGLAIGGCGCLVLSLAFGFFATIIIAVGQHHPPQRPDDEAVDLISDLSDNWNQSKGNEDEIIILNASLPRGSWWTDGCNYYQVVKSKDDVLLRGMNLHEGGFELRLNRRNDSLFTVRDEDGLCSFGENGSPVEHLQLTTADSSRLELLVAYKEDASGTPIAVLQRFDGDELQYELSGIATLLAGTYTDEEGRPWEFDECQRIRHKDSGSLQPYQVEKVWHMPTNVIRLTDGQRYGVEITDNKMLLFKAEYDNTEEFWTVSDMLEEQLTRSQPGNWMSRRILGMAMCRFLGDTDLLLLAADPHPLAQLNALILHRWKNSCAENDGGDGLLIEEED